MALLHLARSAANPALRDAFFEPVFAGFHSADPPSTERSPAFYPSRSRRRAGQPWMSASRNDAAPLSGSRIQSSVASLARTNLATVPRRVFTASMSVHMSMAS